MARISVLLPAPFGPSTADELAVRDRQADVVQRLDAPVARREPPDLENRTVTSRL